MRIICVALIGRCIRDKNSENEVETQKFPLGFSDVYCPAHKNFMKRCAGHVSIYSHFPHEFKVNSVQGGARVSSFLFCVVAIGV